MCSSWPPGSLKKSLCCLANNADPFLYWWWPYHGAVFWLLLYLHHSGARHSLSIWVGRRGDQPSSQLWATPFTWNLEHRCSAQSPIFPFNFSLQFPVPTVNSLLHFFISAPSSLPQIKSQRASEIKLGINQHRSICDHIKSSSICGQVNTLTRWSILIVFPKNKGIISLKGE